MGLDIYLERASDAAINQLHYSIWEEDDEGHSRSENMTKEEITEWMEAHPSVNHETEQLEQYPEHYFGRNYLRSSYNSGGFNTVVPLLLGNDPRFTGIEPTFYWIFEPLERNWHEGEDAEPFTEADIEHFNQCRARAQLVADALLAVDGYSVMACRSHFGGSATSPAEALEMFRAELAKQAERKMPSGWYSSSAGDFFLENPPEIYAVIQGTGTFGEATAYLVYRPKDNTWYQEAALITVAFCERAIELIQQDGSCTITWSA